MDVKFWSFDIALENWQTAQMPPGKSPEKSPFGLELSVSVRWWWMEECFSVQITWKILLKINKNPGKLKFMDLPPWNSILSGRAGKFWEDSQINFFTQSILLTLFLTDHSPVSKASTHQNRFFKTKPNKILGLLIFSIGTKWQQS